VPTILPNVSSDNAASDHRLALRSLCLCFSHLLKKYQAGKTTAPTTALTIRETGSI